MRGLRAAEWEFFVETFSMGKLFLLGKFSLGKFQNNNVLLWGAWSRRKAIGTTENHYYFPGSSKLQVLRSYKIRIGIESSPN